MKNAIIVEEFEMGQTFGSIVCKTYNIKNGFPKQSNTAAGSQIESCIQNPNSKLFEEKSQIS